jgi:hypothetical protein
LPACAGSGVVKSGIKSREEEEIYIVAVSKLLALASPALFAVGLALLTTSAQADVFDFTITSQAGDATGQFTVVPSGGPSPYIVTDVTGTINNEAITGVLGIGGFGGNDNKLYVSPTNFADRSGIGFVAGGIDYNIFSEDFSVPGDYALCVSGANSSCLGNSADSANSATFSVSVASAVPEASTWAMMILGFLGVGFAAYRRKQSGATPQLA